MTAWSISFIINSLLLGVGLAMDAFSVSLANGLREPHMSRRKMVGIAGIFALFQMGMPLAGWVCVRRMLDTFQALEPFIPWISLILLVVIGVDMARDGIRGDAEAVDFERLTLSTLLVQGVATSIDALSVGFTIAEYGPAMAVVCSALIAAVTFLICLAGVRLGRTAGGLLSRKAMLLGGMILIAVGVEIWATSIF